MADERGLRLIGLGLGTVTLAVMMIAALVVVTERQVPLRQQVGLTQQAGLTQSSPTVRTTFSTAQESAR
jgi:hypothetical protein